MHGNEWSLMVFTLLAQMSVGLFILREAFHWVISPKYGVKAADDMSNGSLFVIGPLLLIALVVSFFHLGNPVNAIYALDNLASSWLSREIFLEILFIGAFTLYAFLQLRNISTIPIRRITALVTGFIGLLLVFSMAKIYMLPTVPVWNNIWTPVFFFITTFLLGCLALAVIVALKSRHHPLLARFTFNRIALVSTALICIEILITALFSLFPGIPGETMIKSMTGLGSQNIIVLLRFIFLLIGAGLTIFVFYRTGIKEGMASPTYYCSRNTQVPEEKSWDENKVLQYSNTDRDTAIKNRFVYAAFLLVFFAEGLGRYLFYAAYANIGV